MGPTCGAQLRGPQERGPEMKAHCHVIVAVALLWAGLLPNADGCGEESAGLIESRRVIVRDGGFFPVLVTLNNGELVAVIRGKFPHIIGDGRLDLIRSQDEGKTWSAPEVAVDVPKHEDRNPAFGQLADGSLVLAWMRDDLRGTRGI